MGVLIGLLVIVLAALVTFQAGAAEVEYMAKLSHGSDLFRGCPLHCGTDEFQYDAITGGATITAGKHQRWEIDLSHGWKRIERGPSEGASEFSVRYYPLRRMK